MNFGNNQNNVNRMNAGYANNYPNLYQQIFVQGIEGAKAFQMPYGVTTAILWDTEADLFYVKQIDSMGRPFISKTCSYADYIPPEPAPQQPAEKIDTSNFITKEYLDQVLNQLFVGEKGRVVRDESAR